MQLTFNHGPVHRTRKVLGASVFAVLFLIGLVLLAWLFAGPLFERTRCGYDQYLMSLAAGAVMAVPAVVAYMFVPMVIDRFDPEPWWALGLAFVWGAVIACGFSGLINTIMGAAGGALAGQAGSEFIGSVVSAPLVEEFWKGALVLLMYLVWRTEFDGVVDGVIYATFVALGFACVENVLYYGRSGWMALEQTSCNTEAAWSAMKTTFVLRGVLSPWGHPLYTSMTGLGIGIARETNRTWLKVLAPIGGYMAAVVLHAVWNGSALLSDATGVPIIVLTILLYLLFVALFTVLMMALVVREGRIIRRHLTDEVMLGTLSAKELDIVCSPFGRVRAVFSLGGLGGRKFVAAAATLALKKWHTARAMQGKKMTVSVDFIAPLRQELLRIRSELGLAAPAGAWAAAQQGYPPGYGPQGYGMQGYGPGAGTGYGRPQGGPQNPGGPRY